MVSASDAKYHVREFEDETHTSTDSLLALDSVLNGKIIGKKNLFCFSPTMLEFTKTIYLFLVEMGFGSFSLK